MVYVTEILPGNNVLNNDGDVRSPHDFDLDPEELRAYEPEPEDPQEADEVAPEKPKSRVVGPLESRVDAWLDSRTYRTLTVEDACRALRIPYDQYDAEVKDSYERWDNGGTEQDSTSSPELSGFKLAQRALLDALGPQTRKQVISEKARIERASRL